MTTNPKRDPIWRQAVLDFLNTNPKAGDLVSRGQLEKWFEMKRPKHASWEEMRGFELKFLSNRDRWADELLRKNQIQFDEKDREEDGWRVLEPSAVAGFTRRQSDRELKRALRRQRDRLGHTDLSALTPLQLREHAETLVRCSWKQRALKEVEKKPIELPQLPKALPRRKLVTT